MLRRVLFIAIVLGNICAARGHVPAQGNPKDYTTHVVGYAHIDMAWLWRWEESIYDIMYNTFRNQLDLMDRYPEFTFAQDQAMVYDLMDRYYPDIYKAILKRA